MSEMKDTNENLMISIIVPVYKSAVYLKQCIESILKQSFQEFELLLIDDGSPDESPVICDSYAHEDNRVRVIHKENGGVSSARNTGIDLARGQYIIFIDSDDYVGKYYLSDMLDVEIELRSVEKNILVLSDYQSFTDNGNEERIYPEAFIAELIPNGTTVDQFRNLVFDFRFFPPYCKLYRRDIIEEKHLRFDTVLKSAEDFDFNRRYIEYIDKICYIPSIQYYYRVGYKTYTPSNKGVLGQSEIKSVHIMANGIISLAKRLNVYNELHDEICLWAAKKQYFNRLPMLFAENKKIGLFERYRLYKQLTGDLVYHNAYKQGVCLTEKSTTRLIGNKFDYFLIWWLFYKLVRLL